MNRDEKGRLFFGSYEYGIQALIVLSLVASAFETLPELDPLWRQTLRMFEIATILIFSVEYLMRIYFCSPRFSYAASYMGIIDLIAILPFFLMTGFDLRSVRVFRLFRLVRLLKMARYGKAMTRYYRAFLIAREELVLFGCASLMILYLSSVGIYHFENEAQPEAFSSVFQSMWWALATLTTVGYGDVYPITTGGRIFTFIILAIGLGIVAVPSGLLASALSSVRSEDDQG